MSDPRNPLRATLRPPQASGLGDGHFRLLLTNAGRTDLAVQLEALDPAQRLDCSFEPPLLVVPAGQERYVPLRVRPRCALPGEEPRLHPFAVAVRPTEFPDWAVQVAGAWKQLAPSFDLELRPARARGVVEGVFSVHAANRSLEELTLDLHAADAAGDCLYAFQPAEIVVPAGEAAPAQLRVRTRAPLPGGEPRMHTFAVTARPREAPQVVRQVQGEWEQALPALELDLQPLQPRGPAEGVYHLEVRNADVVELTVGLEAGDAAEACLFVLTPPLVVVPAGQVRPVQVRVLPRAALPAVAARAHPFVITARPAEAPGWTCRAEGEWVQLPAPRPARRTWGPLALLLLGWAAAGGLAAAAMPFLTDMNRVLDALSSWGMLLGMSRALSTGLVSGALVGLVAGLGGGLVTALAARWAEPTLRRPPAWGIFFGWAFCLLVGGAAVAVLGQLSGAAWPASLAACGAAVGLAGGAVSGAALRQALPRVRPWAVALGWAAAWGSTVGLAGLVSGDLYGGLWPLFVGLPRPDAAALVAVAALLGSPIGLVGGLVTLAEIARARRALILAALSARAS